MEGVHLSRRRAFFPAAFRAEITGVSEGASALPFSCLESAVKAKTRHGSDGGSQKGGRQANDLRSSYGPE